MTGIQRSALMSQASDRDSDSEKREEQAQSIIPKFSTWVSDSHLHSLHGKSMNKTNVDGYKQILETDDMVCCQCEEAYTKQECELLLV